MMRVLVALALGASAFENSYLNNIAKRAVQANTATMDNARVAKDSASYLESLPQASTPTVEAVVAAPSYLESLPSLEAAVAKPAAVKPTATPAELAAAKEAAAPVKLASGAEADFAAQCVDEEALFLASDFPIKPEDIIARAKEVLTLGLGTKDEGACLAEGFEFCAAVVGPIGKEKYLEALGDFKLEESFDVNAQYHMFRVDPLQTNRVWFHTRTLATHVADSKLFGKATGKEIVNPPQCMHMDFTADGLVKEVGFYTARMRRPRFRGS